MTPSPLPDPEAREALDPERFEALRSGLEILAIRALGDPDLAREAAQEALTRATVAWSKGVTTGAGRMGAFVAGIARHVIVDLRRLRARGPALDIDTIPIPSAEPDPLERLVGADERATVRQAIGRLAAADRELLRLCFYEGMTPAEIGERLGEPAERIRKRKSRALARLREILTGGEGHVGAGDATEGVEGR